MSGILWVNLIAFLCVTVYAISLFVYLIKTRITYIRLGKKVEFDSKIRKGSIIFGSMVWGKRSFSRIRRAELCI